MLTSEKTLIPRVENGVVRITENYWGDSKVQVQCLAHPSLLPCPQTHFPKTLTWKTPASKTTGEANASPQHISALDDLELWK